LPPLLLGALACSEDPTTGDPDGSVGSDGRVVNGGDSGAVLDLGTDPCEEATCVDTTVYADDDGDGYGEASESSLMCLLPCELRTGFARDTGDCAPDDAWRHPGASEICGDNLDDDCSGSDSPCPETNTADLDLPSWDCVTGPPPANVYAHALFADGGTYFEAGGCFVLYEGLSDEFYVSRVNLNRLNAPGGCETQINGCTCPSLNGWPSYDRRLYAFTRLEADPCTPVSLRDHAGEAQVVSNDCRKYLYQLHYYDIPYTFMAHSVETVERRLALYPIVEIACAQDTPHTNLPFTSLLTTRWQRNQGFQKK
jgi:hypothetical protein